MSCRTWVMPIDRHSSSHSNFRVPFLLSKYSFGISLSIAFGSWTWRYSNSLSEYLCDKDSPLAKRPFKGAVRRILVESHDIPRRIVNVVEVVLQALALALGEGARLRIATRCVDAHLAGWRRHAGRAMVGVIIVGELRKGRGLGVDACSGESPRCAKKDSDKVCCRKERKNRNEWLAEADATTTIAAVVYLLLVGCCVSD